MLNLKRPSRISRKRLLKLLSDLLRRNLRLADRRACVRAMMLVRRRCLDVLLQSGEGP